MLFSSATFLFAFLPAVTLLYYIIPARFRTARNMLLTLVSILFYAWGEPRFVVVMLAMIAVNWALALLAEAQGDKYRRMVLVTAVAVNISLLFVFKYLTFVLDNTNRFLGLSIQVPSITLPIGISFFTFQAMSYVIDVCRGDGKAQRNILNVMLYIAFFPQLIAGPIVRYSDFADQINCRTESFDGWSGGCCRFALGLGKKVILSNNLAYVADAAFSSIGNMSVLLAWLGAIAYTLQIYFDFSGYSDMAIGLGRMFGFRIRENFNYPYISRSVSEFWRRWHISLGSWFRDYLYIPLGGSRVKSRGRLIFNLFVVWFSTGLWHGANWTFIAWGLMYFVLLCVEKLTGFEKCSVPLWLAWIYTMLFVVLGWVLFRAENLTGAVRYVLAMFGIGASGLLDAKAAYYMAEYKLFFLLAIAASLPIAGWLGKAKEHLDGAISVLYPVWIIGVYAVAVSFIVKGGYNPFIYFNF